MRFELSVALKYLLPKRRQLSVSIISLVSILVISLVVWLVVVFLSVTEGIEKKWVEELVALNAPLRMTPKDAYYHSYYYQIDGVSADSNYSNKSIGEKLQAIATNPYDPSFDSELPQDFPTPDMHQDGSIKDLVKEGWETIFKADGFSHLSAHEYEVAFGNLKLELIRNTSPPLLSESPKETILNQVSYIASFENANKRLTSMLLPMSSADYSNLLEMLGKKREETSLSFQNRLIPFFDHINIETFETAKEGSLLPKSLYPKSATLRGVALLHQGKILKVYIPESIEKVDSTAHLLSTYGYEPLIGDLHFEEGSLLFSSLKDPASEVDSALFIVGGVEFAAKFLRDSLQSAKKLSDLQFEIAGKIQGIPIQGTLPFKGFNIKRVSSLESSQSAPYWIHKHAEKGFFIPFQNSLGEGIVLPKSYRDNGAHLGDQGTISYTRESASGFQEMRLPIYVAGFYDPGLMPAGNRIILTDPKVTALLRTNYSFSDGMIGNGISIWLPQLQDAPKAKVAIQKALEKNNLDKYWKVESFADYELTQPIFQQLQSDKTLFTLIALIILIVACSNIISMLILLVNDKRKEVGILQSMGASKFRIGLIFGMCGLITGLFSSLLGTLSAILTLKYLHSLVSLLNFLQGHEAFHQAFYGSELPNSLSLNALGFVIAATIVISILAGVIPAIKAARIQPSQTLRSE